MNKAVFFDRDDTLIKDVPYNGDPDRVVLMPGARKACCVLKELDFNLFIISNQSGVGRGLISREQVQAVNQRLLDMLGDSLISDVYCCFDVPGDGKVSCRKPSPKMLLQAAKEHNLDLENSIVIGDKLSDVRAGKNAGCFAIYLNTRDDRLSLAAAQDEADYCATELAEAVAWVERLLGKV